MYPGKFIVDKVDGLMCYKMTGNVSTKNNGGFIQSGKINSEISIKTMIGIYKSMVMKKIIIFI